MKRKPDTTLYLVAYDISSDRRRTKLHKLLCGYGEWTQFSLFECHLTAKELIALHSKLDPLLDPEQDRVRFYPLCSDCTHKVDTVGGQKPHDQNVFVV